MLRPRQSNGHRNRRVREHSGGDVAEETREDDVRLLKSAAGTLHNIITESVG